MKSDPECYPCFVRQAVEAGRLATADEKKQWQIIKEVMRKAAEFDPGHTPVRMGMEIHRIVRDVSGNPDPYRDVKRDFNKMAEGLLPVADGLIRDSQDPFFDAVKLITIANIIDFGQKRDELDDLRGFLEKRFRDEFSVLVNFEEFRNKIETSNKILYLVDNCGEIVFDLYFMKRFLKGKTITIVPRSGPVLNDITVDDMKGMELPGNSRVLDPGMNAPGTVPELCNKEFRENYQNADVVISKGQGNFESITGSRDHIYCMLISKCQVSARHLGCTEGDMAFTPPL